MTRTAITALRHRLAISTALGVTLGVFAAPAAAQDTPALPTVQRGVVTFDNGGLPINPLTPNGTPNVGVTGAATTLNVNLASRRALIDWQSFDISSPSTVNFTQTFANSAVLNRVTTGNLSDIAGAMNAPTGMSVWLINTAGIAFGNGAAINVGGLVASTLNIDNDGDFTDLTGTTQGSTVRFLGLGATTQITGGTTAQPVTINTAGGALVLVAPQIDMTSAINVGSGPAAFALATDATVTTSPGGPLSITIGAGTTLSGTVAGTIVGDAVYALLKPQDGVNALLNLSATVTNATVNATGVVVLSGGGLSADVVRGGNTDELRTGAANGGPNPTIAGATVGEIDMTLAGASGGLVRVDAVRGAATAGRIRAGGDVTVGGANTGLTTVAGDVAAGGDYDVTGGSIALGTAAAAVTQTAGGTATFTAPALTTAGTLSVTSQGALTVTGALGNAAADTGTATFNGSSVSLQASDRAGGLVVGAGTGGATFTTLAGAGSKTITSAGAITGTSIDGSGAVALTKTGTAAGTIGISGGIGGTAPIGALTIDGETAVTIGTAGTTTVGIRSTGDVTIGGSAGAPSDPTALTVNGSITAANFRSTVSGNTSLGAVTATTDVGVTGTGAASTITFGGAVNGAGTLNTSAAGVTTFNGEIGTTTPFASLMTTGAGGVRLNTGRVMTAGDQSYNGGVTLGAPSTTLTITTAGTLSFGAGLIGGNNDLTLDVAGTATVGPAITGVKNLEVDSSTGGVTSINGNVSTSGTQRYADATTLAGDATLTSSGEPATGITFGSTLGGAAALTVVTPGTLTFIGAVGAGGAALTSIDATGVRTDIQAPGVVTTGAQTYGATTLTGAADTAIAAGTGAVTFAGVNGPRGLNVDTTGNVALGTVGNTSQLASLTVQRGNAVSATSIDVAGAASFGQTAALGALTITGSTGAASFLSDSVSTTETGAITARAGGIDVGVSAGNVRFTGPLNATAAITTISSGDIVGTTFDGAGGVGLDAGNIISIGGGSTTLGGADFVARATGAAQVTGNVSAADDYSVTGRTVALGDPGNLPRVQTATGAISVVATGGAGPAGQITGRDNLQLRANTGNNPGVRLTIGGANTGNIVFAPTTTLSASANGQGELRFGSLNTFDALQLGDVIAGPLSQTVGGVTGNLDRVSAITVRDLTLRAANTISADGQITARAITIGDGTLTLNSDSRIEVSGAIGNLTGTTGGVTLNGYVGAPAAGAPPAPPGTGLTGSVAINQSDLAGALTVNAGTGGASFTSIDGTGTKTVTSGGAITGGAVRGSGAVTLRAAPTGVIGVDTVGTGAVRVASLTIDGGSAVQLGTTGSTATNVFVIGATRIGQSQAPGQLTVAGNVLTGSLTSRTTGDTRVTGSVTADSGSTANGSIALLATGAAGSIFTGALVASTAVDAAISVISNQLDVETGDLTARTSVGVSAGRDAVTGINNAGTNIGIGAQRNAATLANTAGGAISVIATTGAASTGTNTTTPGGTSITVSAATDASTAANFAGTSISVTAGRDAATLNDRAGTTVLVSAGRNAVVQGSGVGSSSGSSFTVTAAGTAPGTATVNGAVAASGAYSVNAGAAGVAGTVALGGGVSQRGGTTVSLDANGGTVSGGAGLQLTSGTGGITIGGAGTTGIAFGGTTIGAGGLTPASATQDVLFRTATTGSGFVLGDLLANRVGQQIGAGGATPTVVARTGAITTGNLVLGTAGAANSFSTTGAALTIGTGTAGINAVTAGGALTLGALNAGPPETGTTVTTVNGTIGNLGASTAPVTVNGIRVAIDDTVLAGALTLNAGTGGLAYGNLGGTGSKTIRSAGPVSGGRIDDGAVVIDAGAAQDVTVGAIGATTAATSLTINGGNRVSVGQTGVTSRVTGATSIGQAPGAVTNILTVDGALQTGSLTSTTSGTTTLNTVNSAGLVNVRTTGAAGTTASAGDIVFTALQGTGAKTLNAFRDIARNAAVAPTNTISSGGAVTLTAGRSIAVTQIGADGGAGVASLDATATAGSIVIGASDAQLNLRTVGNATLTANAAVGLIDLSGRSEIGDTLTSRSNDFDIFDVRAGRGTTNGAIDIGSNSGIFGYLEAPRSVLVTGTGTIAGTRIESAGSVDLRNGTAGTITVGTIGATAPVGTLTVSGGRQVTLGATGATGTTVAVAGATRIGQPGPGLSATGGLTINGRLDTGSLTSTTTKYAGSTGATLLGDVQSNGIVSITTTGTAAAAGDLRIAFGNLTGNGSKTLLAAAGVAGQPLAGISGTSIDGSGAVSLTAATADAITLTGTVGATAPAASLTIEGGGQVTLGSVGGPATAVNASGAVRVGQTTRSGALLVNGDVRGASFASRTTGATTLGNVTTTGAGAIDIVTQDPAASPTGDVRFGTLTAAGAKTVNAAGGITGASVLGTGAVSLTAAAGRPIMITGAIGTDTIKAASLAITRGGQVTLGTSPTGIAVATAGDILIGQVAGSVVGALTINGAANAGGAFAATTAGLVDLDQVNAGSTLSARSTGGDVVLLTGAAGGDASVVAAGSADVVTLGTVATPIGGTVTITAGNGNAIVGTAVATGSATLSAGGLARAGTLNGSSVSGSGGTVDVGSSTSGSTLTLTAADTLRLGTGSAVGTATLQSGGAQRVDTSLDAGGAIELRTTGATGTVDGNRITSSNGSILAQGTAVTLTRADARTTLEVTARAGNVGITTGLSGGNATVRASGGVALGTLASGGTAIVTASGGDLTGNSLTAGGTAEATAAGLLRLGTFNGNGVTGTGASVDVGSSTSGGSLSLTATGGALALGTGRANGGTATLNATGPLRITTSLTSTGTATVISGADAAPIGTVTSSGGNVVISARSVNATRAEANGTLTVTGTAGGVTLGTGIATNGTATVSATGPLSVGTLTGNGNASATTNGTATVTGITSNAGSVVVSGTVTDVTNASARTTLDLTATTGDLTLGTGTAGGAATLRATNGALRSSSLTTTNGATATLTAGPTLNSVTLNAAGAATLTATGVATLGQTTSGAAVTVTAGSIGAGQTTAATTLTMTSGGNLTLAGGSAGGNATFDAGGTAALGQVLAGTSATLSVRALDAAITGIQRAGTVIFTNRAPTSTLTRLGGENPTGGFALSETEVNFLEANQLTIDAGSGTVEINKLGFDADAGRTRVDVLSTGGINVNGAVSGTGATRTFRFGGTLADTNAKASVIRVTSVVPSNLATATGGSLLFDTADLDLRGTRIGVGQATGFLDPILGVGNAGGLSPADVAAQFVGNPNSSLYNSTFGNGVAYAPGTTLVSAKSLTVRYTDYALFQNTGQPGITSGVTLGTAATGPANGALILQGPGTTTTSAFAFFGTIGGITSTPTAVLGSNVIVANGTDQANTRINGCLVGSGAGCLTAVVSQPLLAIFDSSRLAVFRVGDDLILPFDPLVGTNNEALFSGIGVIDGGISDTECTPDSTDPSCGQAKEQAK